ncbi:PIN domain-containing protein [Dendronalium sp. ChiSLP03b]|uniref:PIN domain-containing protein n=1 Tax=Dendronalium sp. ChiSLP03b TaxID=3075381 RepID=UPI002AD4D852|nr:PIN domain-containing protein [Dendronalium sp. ChiSLP03b]MDZ8204984.1 PIN domain-containing protein [Dendronalium sp. ChiSLP03b]
MKDVIHSLICRYPQKGILVDTNILLLFLVGSVNPERITKFNRTQQFIPEDYELLLEFLAKFQKLVTTPNILTEVNSLANQLGEPERSQCFAIFARFAQNVTRLNEHYIKSLDAVTVDRFVKFGLTDCGILTLARGKHLVLTDDLKLTNYLQSLDIDVINFNNIRIFHW